MKNLKEILTEANVNESRLRVASCLAKGNMKYGFMVYNQDSNVVDVIQFNKLAEYADYNGFDVEDYMGIDKLDVGGSAYDGASYIYTRIW
jgi:hypothetical protein